MTQNEAIQIAKRINYTLKKHCSPIIFVAMNHNEEWFGYDEEPEYNGNGFWNASGDVYRLDKLKSELSLVKI